MDFLPTVHEKQLRRLFEHDVEDMVRTIPLIKIPSVALHQTELPTSD
jgi:hypothetical protein